MKRQGSLHFNQTNSANTKAKRNIAFYMKEKQRISRLTVPLVTEIVLPCSYLYIHLVTLRT